MAAEQVHAERFAELFHVAYLTFHRRDRPRSELQGASRAVLEHLALAGPLTIGEAAAHLDRAQSVISEIVTHLERDGSLARPSQGPGTQTLGAVGLSSDRMRVAEGPLVSSSFERHST